MKRTLAYALVACCLASPAWSQNSPCPTPTPIPIALHVAGPLCAGAPLGLVARACGPCYQFTGGGSNAGGFYVSAVQTLNCLPAVCFPDSIVVPLGTFAAGHYTVSVRLLLEVQRPDSTSCSAEETRLVVFDVPTTCPPGGPLPYTDAIVIGGNGPICPDRPIPFRISGTLPGNCYEFRRLELLPSPIASPLPQPPIARVTIGVNDCLGVPCDNTPRPWQASAMLPPLPHGNYGMIVQLAEVSWCDSTRLVDSLHTAVVPFGVAERCSIPPSPECFLHAWGSDSPTPDCDASVSPGTPARVAFRMWTGTVLAGLQGHFTLAPGALAITNVRPVGIAAGMQLAWQPTPDGATFVLFSTTGRTFHSPCLPPAACPPQADPVLEVTVAPRPGVPIPPLTLLDVHALLAADTLGREVHECPTFAVIPPARICVGRSCDFNADGHLDVRDLVLMARCILGVGPCPDSAASRFDCNADGHLNVDDVVCCARVILRGTLPDSVTTRPAPALRVVLGTPDPTATGLELPVHLAGADLVGSARLALSYPAEVFAGASVELLGDAASWLQVSEAENGELVIGLVAMAPAAQIPSSLDLRIDFTTRAGQTASGDVQLTSAEFVAPDGAVLLPSAPPTSVPPGPQALDLSAARPNPFGRETRFVLSVTTSGDAELGIFDLAGRRVATIHRGPLAAGDHAFAWNGTRDDGSRAADGVYFYRVQGFGTTVTRRLVLLRSQ